MIALLFIIFLPLIEIYVMIDIGQSIGALQTIGLILLTAVIGMGLVRQQGMDVLQDAQTKLRDNVFPVETVMHGAMLLASGVMLIIPGFVTDAIGFLFLIPFVRRKLIVWLERNQQTTSTLFTGRVYQQGSKRDPSNNAQIIDADYEVIDQDNNKKN